MTQITTTQAARPGADRRLILLGAGILLILAVGFRFIGLGKQDLWGDEAYSYIASKDLTTILLRWDTEQNQAHSPLPFLEQKVGRTLWGNTEFGMRFPAACYGVATVLVLYVFLGRRWNWTAGFCAGLVLATHPFAVAWSREARMYSGWLFYGLLILITADAAVRFVRRETDPRTLPTEPPTPTPGLRRHLQFIFTPALNWRWWLLGFLMMLVHASIVHAITTLAGLALCLSLIAVVLLPLNWRASLATLAGAALSGAVFLGSWSLTGLAKLVGYVQSPGESSVVGGQRPLWDNLSDVVYKTSGFLPHGSGFILWGIALVGVLILLLRRRWLLALLLLMVVLSPWITYPVFAKKLFWTGRYTFVALLGYAAGLGVVAGMFWTLGRTRVQRWVLRTTLLLALAVLCAAWVRPWRAILTEPRLQYKAAVANIHRFLQPNDVVFMVPDWYTMMTTFYPLPHKTRLLIPPPEAMYNVYNFKRRIDRWPAGFAGDFTYFFIDLPNEGYALPSAAWVVMIDPNTSERLANDPPGTKPLQRLERIRPILAAYGVDTPAYRKRLADAAAGQLTLTFRVTPNRLDYLTTTPPRNPLYQ